MPYLLRRSLSSLALCLAGALGCSAGAKSVRERDAAPTMDASRPSSPDGGRVGDAGLRKEPEAGATDGATDAAQAMPTLDVEDWQRRVIYLAMPDRFVNGDPENDEAGQADCFDPANPGKFHGGDLRGLRTSLDYLGELGVGALWTTPLYRQISPGGPASCGYHGYWADLRDPDDGALEPKLGDLNEARALVSDLHTRQMKYIADLVVNHTSRSAGLRAQYPDWFHPPRPACRALGAEDIYCDLAGLPDFAQENAQTASYLNAFSEGWLARLGADGIRMDTVKHVSVSYFSAEFIPRMRAQRGDVFLLGEHLTGTLAPYKPYLDAGFHSMFNFPLRDALVSALAKAGSLNDVAVSVQNARDTLGMDQVLLLTNLLDNHDVPRFLNEAGELEPSEAWRRYRLALALLFTLPGIPQLYYGDELGMHGGENRRDMPSWAFDAQARADHHDAAGYTVPDETFRWVQQLSELRHAHPALYAGKLAEMWRPGNSGQNAYAFLRTHAQERLLVIVHAGGSDAGPIALRVKDSQSLDAADKRALPDGVKLLRLLGHAAPEMLTVEDGKITLELPAQSFGVYALAP